MPEHASVGREGARGRMALGALGVALVACGRLGYNPNDVVDDRVDVRHAVDGAADVVRDATMVMDQAVDVARDGVVDTGGSMDGPVDGALQDGMLDASDVPDGTVDGGMDAADASADASDAGRPCNLTTMTWTIAAPVRIDELNSVSNERRPTVMASGDTVLFGSDRAGGAGGTDLYTATRAHGATLFAAPRGVASLNTTSNEEGLAFVAGEGAALFVTDRSGVRTIWTASYSVATGLFTGAMDVAAFDSALLANLDPCMPSSGAHVYFARQTSAVPATADLQVSTATASDAGVFVYGAPMPITELNTVAAESGPTVAADERVILFASARPGGGGQNDLWIATRATATAAFGTPTVLPMVNTVNDEVDPYLSPDQCTLYFASNRVGVGGYDLYRATITAP